ncbi:MAG: radical SAM protein [Thermosphaera sp.]
MEVIKKLKNRWFEAKRLADYFDKRFTLNADVYFIKGAKRGAIYDVLNGNIYAVNSTLAQILELAMAGLTPGEISKALRGINLFQVVKLLSQLMEQGLGYWYEGEALSPKSYRELLPPPLKLHFAWLELTNNCNLRCMHCYTNSPTQSGESLSLQEWQRLLLELADMGCEIVQFTGGEPLLVEGLPDLIRLAKRLGIQKVEVFSNLTLLTEEMARFLDLLTTFKLQATQRTTGLLRLMFFKCSLVALLSGTCN